MLLDSEVDDSSLQYEEVVPNEGLSPPPAPIGAIRSFHEKCKYSIQLPDPELDSTEEEYESPPPYVKSIATE